jgi:hypothetical protein
MLLRMYAIQRRHPLYMRLSYNDIQHKLRLASCTDDQAEAKIVVGINKMVELVHFIDEKMINCWSEQCTTTGTRNEHVSAEQVCALLKTHSHSSTLSDSWSRPIHSGQVTDDVQLLDVLITRQWISNRLWHLALLHGYLSDDSEDREMRPSYSFEISQEALYTCESFSNKSLEVHGIGIVSSHLFMSCGSHIIYI